MIGPYPFNFRLTVQMTLAMSRPTFKYTDPNNIGKYTITAAESEILDWTLPLDLDWDAMGDAWEEHGLDTSFDDSGEDPDGDGISNLEEYWYNTDPMEPNAVKGTCGCQQGQAANLLVFLLPILGLRRK